MTLTPQQAHLRLDAVDDQLRRAKKVSTSYSEQQVIQAVEYLSQFLRAALAGPAPGTPPRPNFFPPGGMQ